MSTDQAKIASINLSSSCLEFEGLASTINTKFTIRIIVNLANCMKNFLHNQGVTATNLNMSSIYFASLRLN
jgi:hypothetical protein